MTPGFKVAEPWRFVGRRSAGLLYEHPDGHTVVADYHLTNGEVYLYLVAGRKHRCPTEQELADIGVAFGCDPHLSQCQFNKLSAGQTAFYSLSWRGTLRKKQEVEAAPASGAVLQKEHIRSLLGAR